MPDQGLQRNDSQPIAVLDQLNELCGGLNSPQKSKKDLGEDDTPQNDLPKPPDLPTNLDHPPENDKSDTPTQVEPNLGLFDQNGNISASKGDDLKMEDRNVEGEDLTLHKDTHDEIIIGDH